MTLPPPQEFPHTAMLMLTSKPTTNQTTETISLENAPPVVDIRNYTNWRLLANCKGEEKSCDLDISVLQVISMDILDMRVKIELSESTI